MELLNKDALDMFIDLLKKSPNFDKDALTSIRALEDDQVVFLLYQTILVMNKLKAGTYNLETIAPLAASAAQSSPEGKVIKSYLEYLKTKVTQSEGFDKIPYLRSIESFVNWMHENVNFVQS